MFTVMYFYDLSYIICNMNVVFALVMFGALYQATLRS